MARKDPGKLRDEAGVAVEKGKFARAVELYGELEAHDPTSPTWPKRIGEVERKAGNNIEAIVAFERAADKFVKSGFLVQAIAVCKLILQIEPTHSATVTKLAELAGPAPKTAAKVSAMRRPPTASSPPSISAAVEAFASSAAIQLPADSTPTKPTKTTTATAGTTVARDQIEPKAPRVATEKPATNRSENDGRYAAPSRALAAKLNPPTQQIPPLTARPKVDLERGAALDSLEISTLVPNAKPIVLDDGNESGMVIIPVDDIIEYELEIEADAATRSGIEAAIEELELLPVELDDSGPVGIDPEARLALSNTPLFAKLSPATLEDLIPRIGMVTFAPGDLVFREGDAGATLYVISEGEVIVETAGKELARLGPSAFFGEIALVTELPRSATVRCATDVELLSIDRDVLRAASAEKPEIINVVLGFLRDRLVDRLSRTGELFRGFTEGDRQSLTKRFELVEVANGTQLIVQGKRADGLYVMLAGKVDVRRTGDTSAIATLSSGDVFGEMSLLSGGGSVADVKAITRVLALRMPARTFTEVIMTHPQVLEYLGELAARRSPAPPPSEDMIDLHLDLL